MTIDEILSKGIDYKSKTKVSELQKVAEKYRISLTSIYDIKTGRTWRNV